MNRCIKHIQTWFEQHPKTKQWAWFFVLWLGGLLTVMLLSYPIKLLIKYSQGQ